MARVKIILTTAHIAQRIEQRLAIGRNELGHVTQHVKQRRPRLEQIHFPHRWHDLRTAPIRPCNQLRHTERRVPHSDAIHSQRVELQPQICRNGVAEFKKGARGCDLQESPREVGGIEQLLVHVERDGFLAKIARHLLNEHVLEMHADADAVGAVNLSSVTDVAGGADDQLACDAVDFVP